MISTSSHTIVHRAWLYLMIAPEVCTLSYQTREAIAYLETVVKEPAHFGWVTQMVQLFALLVAIQRPDLVKSVISIGGNFITQVLITKWVNHQFQRMIVAEYTIGIL
jgi:hypothetical protein